MTRQKVIIRADGSSTIGYGHVHRMLVLAQMLKDTFQCIFVSHEKPSFLLEELNKISVPFIEVPRIDYPSASVRRVEEEVTFDMDHILDGSEIIVTDGYWFGIHYHKRIKARGCKSVCIDDEARNDFASDAVINHSPGLNIDLYRGKGVLTSFFLGPGYTLVSVPEAYRKQKSDIAPYESLIIGMGAVDPSNFTCKVLNNYRHFISRFKSVVVIIGERFGYSKNLQDTLSQYSNVEVVRNLRKEEVYRLMSKASCAILSSSTMAVEYAQTGGMLGIIQTAENQRHLYYGLLVENIALPVDDLVKTDIRQQRSLLTSQKEIFDGKSSERVVRIFKDLETQFKIKMISATEKDIGLTYTWASSPQVRRYAFNQNEISLKEHEDWFRKKINDKNCIYFIGVMEGQAIGSVRFDMLKGTGLISYLTDPGFAGKGLGRLLLAEGILSLIQLQVQVSKIEGYVLPGNIASIKIFERMGFQKEVKPDRIHFYINLN